MTSSTIELSFSLLMPMISDAAVTTIQKTGLESKSAMFTKRKDRQRHSKGHYSRK